MRSYPEAGTTTTPFGMTVLNNLDRFHLVIDTVDRLPQTGQKRISLKRQRRATLLAHKEYTDANGTDLPEIREWSCRGAESTPRSA